MISSDTPKRNEVIEPCQRLKARRNGLLNPSANGVLDADETRMRGLDYTYDAPAYNYNPARRFRLPEDRDSKAISALTLRFDPVSQPTTPTVSSGKNGGFHQYLCGYDSLDGVFNWPNRDPLGDEAFFQFYTQGKSQNFGKRLRGEAIKPVYVFVGNSPTYSIDPLGLKMVDTGIQTCFYPIHWYIRITGGAAYGLHPTGSKFGSPGEIDNEDEDFPDDVKHEGCANVRLDDCAYDINKFKKCVLIKIQLGIAHPPYFNVVTYNCTSWMNEVLDDCEEFAKKK